MGRVVKTAFPATHRTDTIRGGLFGGGKKLDIEFDIDPESEAELPPDEDIEALGDIWQDEAQDAAVSEEAEDLGWDREEAEREAEALRERSDE